MRRTLCLITVAILGIASLFAGDLRPVLAQSGADVAAGITADRHSVKPGTNITFTITATNVGDATATGVTIEGWVPDWFNFVSMNCNGGTQVTSTSCNMGDLAPGASASITFVTTPINGNPKGDRHVFEEGFVSATNDTNLTNDTAQVKVQISGKPGK